MPIKSERQLLTVLRYVERNALTAGLVAQAEEWEWCSLWRRHNRPGEQILHAWPIPVPDGWLDHVNRE